MKDDGSTGSAGARTGALRSALDRRRKPRSPSFCSSAPGLLLKSFAKLTRVNPGFSVDHVLTAQVSLPPTRYATPPRSARSGSGCSRSARQIPGRAAVGADFNRAVQRQPQLGIVLRRRASTGPNASPPHARQDQVDGDYFRAMGIPLVDGRLFGDADAADAPRVVIVDRFLGERQFAGRRRSAVN